MSENVGWATLGIIPSLKGFRDELDRNTRGTFGDIGRRGGRELGDVAGKEARERMRSRLSSGFGDIFGPAAAALSGGALFAGFKAVIDDASQAEQAAGGVRAVFKQYADEVIADSKRAAQGVGLSSTAYQELVTLSGALLKNKGLKDFADQADGLVKIGADLAATYGGSTKDAVDALNAALRGESDPIERYAISLNETAVSAELARRGQNKLTGAALEQAKTQARLAIIMRQSKDAQGAFAREADTFAGRQQRLSATWADLRTEIGEQFLPVAAKATEGLGDFLQQMQDGKGAGGALVDALGDIRDVGEGVVDLFDSIPGPLKDIGVQAGIAALVFPRLATGFGAMTGAIGTNMTALRAWTTEMSVAQTRSAAVSTGLGRMGAAAKTAAGVGGMVALSEGLQSSNRDAGFLLTTLGGAATGFAFGGPLGGLVGGLGGAFVSMGKQSREAAEMAEQALPKYKGYEDTFRGIAAAATDATRATALHNLSQTSALEAGRLLGLNQETLIRATLGGEKATKALSEALERGRVLLEAGQVPHLKNGVDAYNALKQAMLGYATESERKSVGLIKDFRDQREAVADQREQADALKRIFDNWPNKIENDIRANGLPETAKEVADLVRQYGIMDKRKIDTLITASGIDTTIKKVNELRRAADEAARRRTLEIELIVKNLVPAVVAGIEAGGGSGGRTAERTAGPAIIIENQTVQAHDYDDFLRQQQQRAALTALTGIR